MAGGMARPGVTKGQREGGEGGRDRGRGQTGGGKDRGTGEKHSRGIHCSYQNLLDSLSALPTAAGHPGTGIHPSLESTFAAPPMGFCLYTWPGPPAITLPPWEPLVHSPPGDQVRHPRRGTNGIGPYRMNRSLMSGEGTIRESDGSGEDAGEARYQAGSAMVELLQGWLTVAGLSEHGIDSHNQGDRGSCPSASFSGRCPWDARNQG